MRAIGYVRVSTDGQADHGISLDMQRTKVEAYASLHDLELVEVICDEGWSAKSLQRPGVQRMLARVDAGEVEAVVVYKLDRLSRRTRDVLDLVERFERANVALHSIQESLDTQSAIGRFVLRTLASLAEMERDLISERTRDALAHVKAQGKHVGRIGFADADVIRGIKRCRAEGWTYQDIVADLNARQVPTARGGQWSVSTVHQIVARA
jgi:site-specific DNA recombinase